MRYDIYRVPHKGQRRALFLLGIALGRINAGDAAGIETLTTRLRQILAHIADHSANEERFLTPLYARAGFDARMLDEQHAALDASMRELSELLRSSTAQLTDHQFYRRFQSFVAAYLNHLEDEERAQVDHLWPNFSDEQLIEAQAAFMVSRNPMTNLADLSLLLPSLNIDEAVQFLSALKRDVPAEPFAMILALARQSLEPAIWSTIEARLMRW